MPTPRLSILDKIRHKLATKKGMAAWQADAFSWYRDMIKKLGPVTKDSLLSDKDRSRSRLFPGYLYLFAYSAKHKKTLPYWDRLPLILPVGLTNDGFYGINFHYLNYKSRLYLLNELMTIADRHINDPRARMLISYQMLKGMARFKAFKPCFKRYLSNYVVSNFVKIESADWTTAIFLPVENFAKKSKSTVWKISQGIIDGTMKPDGTPVVTRTLVTPSIEPTTIKTTKKK